MFSCYMNENVYEYLNRVHSQYIHMFKIAELGITYRAKWFFNTNRNTIKAASHAPLKHGKFLCVVLP